jgi:virginiamycin A acetyltransferase
MKTFINPNEIYPVKLSDGSGTWPHTVFLKNVIQHPNINIGDYTYLNDFRLPVDDVRKLLIPYKFLLSDTKTL